MPFSNTKHYTSISSPANSEVVPKVGLRRLLTDRRAWRTLLFFGWIFARAIWWERVVKRTLGEGIAGRGREARLGQWAREFRDFALSMTGLMIKLGQFVGSRADVLPPIIIEPLQDLLDEVPSERWEDLRAIIEAELGPLDSLFAWVDEETIGSASLGQVHRAQLHDGDRVVVKVQRPGIDKVVRTDLAALNVVAHVAMNWQFIAQRINLPLLLEEFARASWEELDYIHESGNAERFARNFAHAPGVYVPRTYPQHTTEHVLVLEDVTAIKVSDCAAIDAAGVSRVEVAQRLLDTYMQQVFEDRFFHADPHPGNLFVYPLDSSPSPDEGMGRPFYLVFIDFGMTGRLTPQIVEGIREALLSVFTQDVGRMVRSFQRLGVLLPGADLDRIEEALQTVFDRVWGLDMSQMLNVAYADMEELAREFGDVLYETPFQMPQDFIYLGRTLSILSGMCTAIDPDFNPWDGIAPYAQKLVLDDEAGLDPIQVVTAEAGDLLNLAMRLPRRVDTLLQKVERGEIRVQIKPSRDFQHQVDRLEMGMQQVVLAMVFVGVLLAGALLYVGGATDCGTVGFVVAGLLLVGLLWRGRPRPFG